MTDHKNDHLEPELQDVARSLDDLGTRERDATPAGLEQRLVASTLPHLRGEAHAGTPADAESPVIARIGFQRSWALRLAAAVAIIAGAGLIGLSILRGPSGSTGPASPPFAERTTDQIITEIDAEIADWLTDVETLAETDSTLADFWEIPDEELATLLEEETS